MIYFIDEKTGVPFNQGNYDSGYTFAFGDQQSINLFYQKRIIFISDKKEVDVSFPASQDIFFIYNVEGVSDSGKYDINDLRTQSYTSTGSSISNGMYLHCVNAGSRCSSVGEFEEDITIDGSKYKVIANFYGQDESLEILLSNQGINIPHDVIRAIYDTNVHEDATDWITLNRKYKELLLNIMDIFYQKGSYKSLMKSLDWFEYGDVIKMHEYWSSGDLVHLHESDITHMYTELVKELMATYRKTTFISIELPLDKIVEDENGIVYNENPLPASDDRIELTVPVTEEILNKWSTGDLILKLALLGNYFSIYFMPIHLDLLFSSVSNVIYDIIKTKTLYTAVVRVDEVYNINSFDIVEYRDKINLKSGDGKIVRGLGTPSHTYYIRDMVALMDKNSSIGIIDADDIDVDTEYPHNSILVKTAAKIPLVLKKIGKYDAVKIMIVHDDGVCEKLVEDQDNISINIYIRKPGKYSLGINLITDTGDVLSRSLKVEIKEPISNHFDFYVMKRKYFPLDQPVTLDIIEQHEELNNLCFPNVLTDKEIPWHDATALRYANLYYPDRVCNQMAACVLKDDEGIVYYDKNGDPLDGLPWNWLRFDRPVKEFVNDDHETVAYNIVYIVNVLNNDEVIYARSNNQPVPYTRATKKNTEEYFIDRRFIPFLWEKNEVVDLTGLSQDSILMCVPEDTLPNTEETYPTWRIVNESSGLIGYINYICSPIFCLNNNLRSFADQPGVYSVSLTVNYGTDKRTYTRPRLFRVK